MTAPHRFVLIASVVGAFLFSLAGLVDAQTPKTSRARAVDTSGRAIDISKPHIAEYEKDGQIVVYQKTPGDIEQLRRELRQLGVADDEPTLRQNLLDFQCSISQGKCVGGCGVKACVLWGNIAKVTKAVPVKFCVCSLP